jgi:hypothetical protein
MAKCYGILGYKFLSLQLQPLIKNLPLLWNI